MTSPLVALPQSILGIDLYKVRTLAVYVGSEDTKCLVTVLGSKSGTIVKIFEFSAEKAVFSKTGEVDYSSLTAIFTNVANLVKSEKIESVRLIFPSWICSFKSVDVMFCEKEKIESTLAFQIDGILPIETEQASTDFLIQETHQDKTSNIFLVAVDSKILHSVDKIATRAGFAISATTVDLLGFWGQARDLGLLSDNKVVIVLAKEHCTLVFTKNGSISSVKNIWGGISGIFVSAAEILGKTYLEFLTQLNSVQDFLKQDRESLQAIESSCGEFSKKINQSVKAFSSKSDLKIESAVLFCESEIEGMFSTELEKTLGIKVQRVLLESVFSKVRFKNRASYSNNTLVRWQTPILCTTNRFTADFDIGKKVFVTAAQGPEKIRALVMAGLMIAFFGYTVLFNHFRSESLRSNYKNREALVVDKLRAAISPYSDASLKRADLPKLIAAMDGLTAEMENSLVKSGDGDLAPLDAVFKITNRNARMLAELKLEKIKITFENGQKNLKLKGVFKKPTSETDSEKFFEILRASLKCDQKSLKFKDGEGFSVTFSKNIWAEESK